jgi:hypothetical protein
VVLENLLGNAWKYTGKTEGAVIEFGRVEIDGRPAWFVRLARTLADSTRPNEIVLGFGLNANPEVPYYSKRRALMWSSWVDPSGVPEATLARFREHAGLASTPAFELPAGARGSCSVYLRTPDPVAGDSTSAAGPG